MKNNDNFSKNIYDSMMHSFRYGAMNDFLEDYILGYGTFMNNFTGRDLFGIDMNGNQFRIKHEIAKSRNLIYSGKLKIARMGNFVNNTAMKSSIESIIVENGGKGTIVKSLNIVFFNSLEDLNYAIETYGSAIDVNRAYMFSVDKMLNGCYTIINNFTDKQLFTIANGKVYELPKGTDESKHYFLRNVLNSGERRLAENSGETHGFIGWTFINAHNDQKVREPEIIKQSCHIISKHLIKEFENNEYGFMIIAKHGIILFDSLEGAEAFSVDYEDKIINWLVDNGQDIYSDKLESDLKIEKEVNRNLIKEISKALLLLIGAGFTVAILDKFLKWILKDKKKSFNYNNIFLSFNIFLEENESDDEIYLYNNRIRLIKYKGK